MKFLLSKDHIPLQSHTFLQAQLVEHLQSTQAHLAAKIKI